MSKVATANHEACSSGDDTSLSTVLDLTDEDFATLGAASFLAFDEEEASRA